MVGKVCICVYIFPSFVHREIDSSETPIAMNTPNTQSLGSKYHSPLKGNRASSFRHYSGERTELACRDVRSRLFIAKCLAVSAGGGGMQFFFFSRVTCFYFTTTHKRKKKYANCTFPV